MLALSSTHPEEKSSNFYLLTVIFWRDAAGQHQGHVTVVKYNFQRGNRKTGMPAVEPVTAYFTGPPKGKLGNLRELRTRLLNHRLHGQVVSSFCKNFMFAADEYAESLRPTG